MILEEYNFQYYEEYKRLYQTAFLLSLQLKNLSETKDELWQKLGRLEVPSLTIRRKKPKISRMIFVENRQKGRKDSEELLNKSPETSYAQWKGAKSAMDLRGLYNNT